MIRRFDMLSCAGGVVVPEPDVDGEWIRYSEYSKLEADNQRLKDAVFMLSKNAELLFDDYYWVDGNIFRALEKAALEESD